MNETPVATAQKPARKAKKAPGDLTLTLPASVTQAVLQAAQHSPYSVAQIKAMVREASLKHLESAPTVGAIVAAAMKKAQEELGKIG